MPRGGKREGAGPKPTLSDLERIGVAARYEKYWHKLADANLYDAVDAATANVRKEHKRLEDGKIHSFDEHNDDVRNALSLDRGLSWDSDEIPSPYLHVRGKRPKGVRKELLAKVAKEFGISARMVESCVKEYRSLQKEEIL